MAASNPTIAEMVQAAWNAESVERYAARKKKNPDLGQPSLFETSTNPYLKELGPGRWITIHSEKSEGGNKGGHRVYIGDDGKMKTGKFAGQSMKEAFGERKKPKPKAEKQKLGQGKLFDTQQQENLPGFAPKPEAEAKPTPQPMGNQSKPKPPQTDLENKLDELGSVREKSIADAKANREAASQQPGIAPPKPRDNSEAKAGDQIGLFGDIANVPKSGPAKLKPGGESKGKQENLFGTDGDPDQMMMFDTDGHTPRDRLMGGEESEELTNEQVDQLKETGFEGEPDSPKPNVRQRLIDKAHGNGERSDVQAARRLLAKRGVNRERAEPTKAAASFAPKASEPKTGEGKDSQGRDYAPGVSKDTISRQLAVRAHSGTSHVPGKRADQAQAEFAETMNRDYAKFKKMAEESGTTDLLGSEWTRYLGRSKEKFEDHLSASSRVMSSMITGPARFPVAKNRKANEAERKKGDAYLEHLEKGRKAIAKKLQPEKAPVKVGDSDAGSRWESQLKARQDDQAEMKAVNAAIRKVANTRGHERDSKVSSFKSGYDYDSAVKYIMETAGVGEKLAKQSLETDYMGRAGIPSFMLTNNNAQINRLKKQVERQSRFEKAAEASGGTKSHDFDGGKVHMNYEENRLQIAHDSKPDAETIKKLKSAGFRWSPRNKAWQRQLTNAAVWSASDITGLSREDLGSVEKYSIPRTHLDWPAIVRLWNRDESTGLNDRLGESASVERFAASEAQREAGNCKMGHVRLHGLNISIETKKGERRRPEWPAMPADYGYIKGTEGRDGDHVDVFLGPDRNSELVVIVDQVNKKGGFDEHKCLLGWSSKSAAIEAYKRAYTKGWKVGPVSCVTIEQFKDWLKNGNTKKAAAPQVVKYSEPGDYLSLVGDLVPPEIIRYEWSEAAHPRHAAGTPGGKGGEFAGHRSSGNRPGGSLSPRQLKASQATNPQSWVDAMNSRQASNANLAKMQSARKREIAELPDTVRQGHALHITSLNSDYRDRLLGWKSSLDQLMEPVTSASGEQEQEAAWSRVDKNAIRQHLDQMNQLDRGARASGVELSDFVNANAMIPRALAERLDGGTRFFDPEKLGSKLSADNKASQEKQAVNEFKFADRDNRKELLKNPKYRAAVERAMGLKPSFEPPKQEEKQQPQSQGVSDNEAPKQPNEASRPATIEPPMSGAMSNRLNQAIQDRIESDNPEAIAHFRSVALDAWKQLKSSAEEHNDALRQITGFFGKHHGALAANIAKGVDPTKLRGFDELVDHAVREYPQLVSRLHGDSESGSAEEGLTEAIREGIRPIPAPDSDEVLDRAEAMVGPNFFDSLDEDEIDDDSEVAEAVASVDVDDVPFSTRKAADVELLRYWGAIACSA